jgi:TPP-dependent 2-oxoacid decarboxylase
MIRHGLTPILFVINNAGYTIEKFIHGKYRYVHVFLTVKVVCLTGPQKIQQCGQLEVDKPFGYVWLSFRQAF